jgi:integrase
LKKVNAALLEEPDWRWRTYFPLALMLGTRRSELLSMRWTDIDMQQRTWRIPETKAGNSHLLPLPSPAMAMLETLPSRGTSEWVFPGGCYADVGALTNAPCAHGNGPSSDFQGDGQPRSSYKLGTERVTGHVVEPGKAWQRIRQRAGVPDVRIHDLRHTLASWLVAQGFNLPLIGRALNHTQTATTARYAHLAMDPVRAALEQTAALMVGGRGK